MLLCVNIDDYPLAVVRRLRGGSACSPLIVADRLDRGQVLAVDGAALEAGARAGQTVTQAVAAARAEVAVYDPAAGSIWWEEVLDALDAISPLVDDVRPGLAFLDMHGIAGEPAQWMAQTRAVLASSGFAIRLGAGENKMCARAAAFVADGTVCASGDERAMLAPLPLALLDLDPNTLTRLRLLGVERLGDLARLPHGPFVRRFGPGAAHWHRCAQGIDATPFVPRGHAVAIEAAIYGEGRADDEAQVIFALRVLLAQIVTDLERCGKRAGSLVLEVELEDTQAQTFEVALAIPTAHEKAMLDVLRAKLEGVTFPSAIVGLRLRAGRLEEGGEAAALFKGDDFDPQTVAVVIARLEAALGETVRRARTRNAHVLEERFIYERFDPPKSNSSQPSGDGDAMLNTDVLVPQLRLLTVTEIDVQLRRGEPAFVGTPPQAVIECAGPWRIDVGWFDDPVSRDEYDVLLEDGELYRIYRQGTRWYLRGAYD
ncbi:MAG: hypothetical protein JO199_08120 [Candidatus Eremiobacteraeota bacterium]|nr:hypothetical protein [Candidatus Eremiobacteraeota bacterium]